LSNEEEYRQCEAENAEEKILHQEKTHGQKTHEIIEKPSGMMETEIKFGY